MNLHTIRTERGLTLEQAAVELGLSPASKGWLSEIENGRKEASVRLALRIERWSGGRVRGASVCAELRGEMPGAGSGLGHSEAPVGDDATLAETAPPGAENRRGNITRTEAAS